ncbi:probable disease resistance RPP8-like protein 2 [Typha latifolia]|uniref:probable disease resistance RPP8-like protein 2 n=1 Tax=Typha latifolia TaxID=4733 RepID=UPI003C2CFB2C
MVEPVISYVVNKLRDYLFQEAVLLQGVQEEFQWIERELRGLLCFLKDADSKQKKDEKVKHWLKDIRDVAYETEDVIDNFLLRIDRFPLTFNSANARCGICRKIDGIERRINELMTQRLAYGLVSLGGIQSSFVNNNIACCYDDNYVVGFEEERRMIIQQLLDPVDQLHVVSIVGIGGLGKTTVAKMVYNSVVIEEQFRARAWLSIAENYTVIDLLKRTIKELTANLKKIKAESLSERSKRIIYEIKEDQCNFAWNEEEMKWCLHELIKAKGRCLIIMDDVWRKELWERIRTAFLATENGSRVIITTRSMEVARTAYLNTNPLELRYLDQTERRMLFLKKIYPTDNVQTFQDDLEEVGEKLLEKCGGLPLSLVVFGGLLSTKEKNYHVWSQVLNKLRLYSSNKSKECNDIISFSYEDLPYDLKSCLLYLASFPEDNEIRAGHLTRLWVAEGLIPERGRQAREEVADLFLEELIRRRLIQVIERKYDGRASRIQMHDLLRGFCIAEAKENTFLDVAMPTASKQPSPSLAVATRRLAFHNGIPDGYIDHRSVNLRTPKLRTIMGFGLSRLEHRLGHYMNGLKLLRVIDVEGDRRLTTLPSEITSMIHLRYLRWIVRSSTGIKSVPSLRNLRNLQTLDMNATINTEDDITSLKNLHCLIHVRGGKEMGRQLAKLTNLRRLQITINEPVMFNPFEKQRSLVSFSLNCEGGFIQMEAFTVFPALRKFKLCGKLPEHQQLPSTSAFPQGLIKLTLEDSHLQKDPMPTLEKLPNLRLLTLDRGSYDGKSMCCFRGGFPQLQQLILRRLEKLEDWKVGIGAMCSLTNLAIDGCRRLKKLPEGLQHIKTLQEVKLARMGNVAKHSIRHVPSICLCD